MPTVLGPAKDPSRCSYQSADIGVTKTVAGSIRICVTLPESDRALWVDLDLADALHLSKQLQYEAYRI